MTDDWNDSGASVPSSEAESLWESPTFFLRHSTLAIIDSLPFVPEAYRESSVSSAGSNEGAAVSPKPDFVALAVRFYS